MTVRSRTTGQTGNVGYKALWPFMLMQILGMALVPFFPQIALWLPGVLVSS